MDSEQQIIVGNRPNDSHSFTDNWQLRSLGEITTSSQYGISSSSGGNYSLPILKMNNLQDGHIDFRDLDFIQLSKAEMESLMLNKGDLLINRTNSIDLVGKAAIYDLEGEYVFASYLVRFRLGPSVLPTFVNYYLNSEPGQRKLKLLATQGVSQANINPSILKKRLFIPIPPILEQQRIVEILCSLDLSINLTTQLIAKKRDIKQATMQQLLTGKTRLPGFSEEWSSRLLSEVCWFQEGPGVRNTQFTSSGIKLLNGTNIYRGAVHLESTDRFISEKVAFGSYAHFLADRGDIIIACSGITIDRFDEKVAFVKEEHLPLCMNTSTMRFKVFNDFLLANFLYHLLMSDVFKKQIGVQATGSAQLNFGPSHVANVVVALPELKEQHTIANILTDMDAEISALEQKRDKIRALKQGMMQELLTGKTRLI